MKKSTSNPNAITGLHAGDVVELKSGGPLMTVQTPEKKFEGKTVVECCYWNCFTFDYETMSFSAVLLEKKEIKS